MWVSAATSELPFGSFRPRPPIVIFGDEGGVALCWGRTVTDVLIHSSRSLVAAGLAGLTCLLPLTTHHDDVAVRAATPSWQTLVKAERPARKTDLHK